MAAGDAMVIEASLRHPERFAEIYRRYFAEIHRYVAGRLGPDAADDLAAETFLAAFRRRAAFDCASGVVRPWLYGIATNLVGQHRRGEGRRYRALARVGAQPPAIAGHEERVAERVTAVSLHQPLMRALGRLSAGDRDVLLLVSLGGLSYEEVAMALAIPVGTVGSRLNRARRKVRAALGGTNPFLDSAPAQDGPDIDDEGKGDSDHGRG